VDGWIEQAKHLQADIERSKATASNIVRQYESRKNLADERDDTGAKVRLLENEIGFNDAVVNALQRVQEVDGRLELVQSALGEKNYTGAAKALEEATKAWSYDPSLEGSQIKNVLDERVARMRKSIVEQLQYELTAFISVGTTEGTIVLRGNVAGHTNLEDLTAALAGLDMLEASIVKLSKQFKAFLVQRLISATANQVLDVTDQDTLHLVSGSTDSLQNIFGSLKLLMEQLHSKLPATIAIPLGAQIMPDVVSVLISTLLMPSIPTELSQMVQFQTTLSQVSDFAVSLGSRRWPGEHELKVWVDQAPRLWLTNRRMAALDEVRKAMSGSKRRLETVERVEKQTVSARDEVFHPSGNEDDWNADWDEEETEEQPRQSNHQDEEEDASAWGLDDDADDNTKGSIHRQAEKVDTGEDETTDAWGWGDEDAVEETPSSAKPPTTNRTPKTTNGVPTTKPQQSEQQEITMTETYTITDIPNAILAIINLQISDAQALSSAAYSKLSSASPVSGLRKLPTLILGMYRAIAPPFYTSAFPSGGGNMHLYNDSMYLTTQLTTLFPSSASFPEVELTTLSTFGKAAYAREMDAQRSIIADLLDGAQGFANCTKYPFSAECDTAIASTLDRLRTIHSQWKLILGHSALLQSIGSLLATAIEKLIHDVEDMDDISEPESQRLTHFCNELSSLGDLFVPAAAPAAAEEGSAGQTLPAAYVSNWFRLQYLGQILESPLVDIKFLWTEAELRLEFSCEEVVDLIRALFEETDLRRRTIGEIRRA